MNPFKKAISHLLPVLKKNIGYLILAVVVIGGGSYLWSYTHQPVQQILTVHSGDFLQQVSASGNVTAATDLNLSFEQAGLIVSVPVTVGLSVKTGQLLAAENATDLDAQLSQMKAGVDLAKAKLQQFLAGSSLEDIAVATDAVTLSKQQLTNAYTNAVTSLNTAYTNSYNAYQAVLNVQNTYFSAPDQQGLKVQDARSAIASTVSDIQNLVAAAQNGNTATVDASLSSVLVDLNLLYGNSKVVRDQCDQGQYYARVSAVDKTVMDTQLANINASLTAIAAVQQTIVTDGLAVQQAKHQLEVKRAPARDSDVAVYQAQIEQAQASLQNVLAQIGKRRIYSPIDGIVTEVKAKVGSVLGINDVAVSVISQDKAQVETFVPEINISLVKVGDEAVVTLDAYGKAPFSAKVISIDPAETIHNGIPTYKVTLQFADQDSRIKSGMTANLLITTDKKSNVISVPQGIIITKDSNSFVQLKQDKDSVLKQVQLGELSSSGQVEITSGLQDGDQIILK